MTHVDPNLQINQIMVGTWDARVSAAVFDVLAELYSAQIKHSTPFHSHHEGYAVLLEEADELWEQIKVQKKVPDAIRKEAIQVAAMALRFLVDVSPRLDGPPAQEPADGAGSEPLIGKTHTAKLCE